MNKTEFLKEMLTCLRWSFSSNEIIDTVLDIEEFFRKGAIEGKSEEQICSELGAPSDVAFELSVSLDKWKKPPSTSRLIRRMTLLVSFLMIGFILIFLYRTSVYIFRDSVILLFVLSIVLWRLLGGRENARLMLFSSTKKSKWILLSIHAMLAALIIIACILRYQLITAPIPTSGDEFPAFSRFTILLGTEYAATLLVICFALHNFFNYKVYYFTLLIHSIGVIFSLNALYFFMAHLDTPTLRLWLMEMLAIYILSVIITIVFGSLIYNYQKRIARWKLY